MDTEPLDCSPGYPFPEEKPVTEGRREEIPNNVFPTIGNWRDLKRGVKDAFERDEDKLDCQLYEFVDSPSEMRNFSEFQTNIAALYKAFQDVIRRVNVKLDGDKVFTDATIKYVTKSIIQGVESVDKQSAYFMRLVGKWSWLVDFYKGQTSLMASELKCKADEFPDFNPHHGTFVHWFKEVSKVFMYRAVQLMVIYIWTVKLMHVVKENMVFDSADVNAYKEALQPMLAAQMK